MTEQAKPTIGVLLASWRYRDHLTVRQAASIIGLSAATLSRIERGGHMDAETQLRLIVLLFTPPAAEVNLHE